MRIITGIARGTRLETLEGAATRPTAERVKEALFSMIQFDIEGREVLDLFAGSGQLGLEALSRGAKRATFVDHNQNAASIIKKNAQKAKLFDRCRVLATDARNYIKNAGNTDEKYNIIFIDPPYAEKATGEILEKIMKSDIIAQNGLVICESGDKEPVLCDGLNVKKHAKYGKTYITLYEKESPLE